MSWRGGSLVYGFSHWFLCMIVGLVEMCIPAVYYIVGLFVLFAILGVIWCWSKARTPGRMG